MKQGTELAEIYKRISLELEGGCQHAKNRLWSGHWGWGRVGTQLSEKEIILCCARCVETESIVFPLNYCEIYWRDASGAVKPEQMANI